MPARWLGVLCSICIVAITLVFCNPWANAQTETATVRGRVTDPTGALVPNATVRLIDIDRGTKSEAASDNSGFYSFATVPPGRYRMEVEKSGFKLVHLTGITVNVQDNLEENFKLDLGAVSESVTVEAGGVNLNTTDATVSTVVDRQFVENIPLNGRSFQNLISLAPGVVLTPAGSGVNPGQFSVSGQRSDANYVTIDGVSANVGVAPGFTLGQGATGAVPAYSALGGTNSLVSVDAMEEFRTQTSSFAPEFGRTPGGQISIVTRSGTNQFHGTAFDYLRNDVLDANDWFSNRNRVPKPRNRQNDFGGVFGAAVVKDRTFFFFSYEGLRLRLPQSQTTVVPSLATRQSAPPAIQPFLNVYPVPNGPLLGGGFAQFNSSYSNPATLDAASLRIDQTVSQAVTLFGRYNYSPSEISQRGNLGTLSDVSDTTSRTHTFTLGLTAKLSEHVIDEVRANYSNVKSASSLVLDSFGGAVPLQEALVFPTGFSFKNSQFAFLILGGGNYNVGKNTTNEQRQIDLGDSVSMAYGHHRFKVGFDYRWLAPFSNPLDYNQLAQFSGLTGANGALSGTALVSIVAADRGDALLSTNFSFYAQDAWQWTPRLAATYGFRWDVNPAPKGKNSANDPFTVQNLSSPTNLALAPQGTPLYATQYGNVAPRLGLAYQVGQKRGWEQVLRGGIGIFYDLGSGSLNRLTTGFPFTSSRFVSGVAFPLTAAQAAPPAFSQSITNSSVLYVASPDLKLPRNVQWSLAFEQSLGVAQVLSLTYIGSVGRDLLRQDTFSAPGPNFPGLLQVTRNTATSDYEALQVQFRRRVTRGLQVVGSYSWSHSIDVVSSDAVVSTTPGVIADPHIDRGNSDFDVRHSFTGAISYDLPYRATGRPISLLIGGWGVDTYITARTAPPVDLTGPTFVVGGTSFVARPNVLPGMPLYLFGPQYPGDKAFNRAAFQNPTSGTQGNFGRNALRGFVAWQQDLAVRRQFKVSEKLGLLFRAEFFNILNHPNFGPPIGGLSSSLFGQSTQTLAASLGSGGLSGGLSPLYQLGGPRSIQLALKLSF